MIPRTDLNLLRVLLAIYETGNVTAAAKQLGISQPAASAALARLRLSLGDPLFIRSGARMEATPRALGVIGRTREVLEIIDRDILRGPQFDPSRTEHEFVLCLSEVGEIVFLPALFERLRRVAPKARLRTISLDPDALTENLHDGKVDAVLGYFPDLTDPHIYQQRLFSHDLTCMLREGHPLAGERLSLEDFCAADHLQVRDGSRRQEMFDAYLAGTGVRLNVVLKTAHYMSVPSLIEQSDLIVVLPRTVADLYAHSVNVQTIEPPIDIARYDLKQYWHARFQQDPRNVWFRRLVTDVFAE
ncbi:LysR family transcriptional regulator [Kerstersia gyiorum]|jgi:DNA-binding transcriptional LysR family regulator|uniref:LysR family transcriptional regulator n=1 Tax=Kerstersia gyiorum TaxID=206506 RepID=UPI00242C2FA6|nr:LysR family transcriptional regulator [Kerstersia gyiorum]MCH4271947.1 LysR family transcriptional regulator [Kerstersia gyiorum]MCI1230237.1 LysR family transcriptional regulator [Kerstersia gyiorum]